MVSRKDSNKARLQRHKRVRGKISGTAACPRLCVYRSLKNIYAQIIDEKLVSLSRVAKTVKGGRKMKFAALMVVGDGNGVVGVGLGKSVEIPDAVNKGIEDAKKNLVRISLKGTTIPHEIVACYGASRVVLKPAAKGTGVIAGGAVRAVLEMAGVKDIRTKALGSRNPQNVVHATINGLSTLRDAAQVAQTRGKSVEEILG